MVFLVAVFLAGAFLVVVFLTVAFLVVVFLAAAFLALVFLVLVFLEMVFSTDFRAASTIFLIVFLVVFLAIFFLATFFLVTFFLAFFGSLNFLEIKIAFSKSLSLHKPTATGFLGRKSGISRCVPSRSAAIVGLVVPISLQICESTISGQLRKIHKIVAGLSLRCEGDKIFLFLLFWAFTLPSGSLATKRAFLSASHLAISSAVNSPEAIGSLPTIFAATSPSAIA